MTHQDFYNRTGGIQIPEGLTLEAYLLSLLKLVEQEKHTKVTAEMVLRLLGDAMTSEPAAFDPEWLKIKKEPIKGAKLNGFD